MAITSLKETSLEYLRNTTLPLINGTGDYNLNPAKITRTFVVPDELDNSDYPCICIIDDGSTSYTPMTSSSYTTGNSIDDITDGFPVLIIGYVTIEDQGNESDAGELSTEMNKLHSDIIIAMLSDINLGDNVISVALDSSATSTIFTTDRKIGTVIQSYAIKYDFSPSASSPTT